ncbi:PQQ-binding-like beta-propeller repeat protein [Streptomyces sp. NBC_00878]|uniref:protein kinase domain-containing protein n=1 Tax=Streptomyces sp. NBC_00878 TaxID=2975854 RepID=UPI00224F5E0F|nr:PQQ-binding-like beta-propeller repeat protein [Streptomyces sp. NBC_00878]MCX4902951.1 PQQ-binding-like beta-propeller repeat protein [Streptomyces sp. NBC_00878]
MGPYRPVARLGAGGMGEVFLARDDQQRAVAVKVIRPELAASKDFRIRFRREVDAARAVSGRYTATVVDADPEGPVPWLATAHILGPTLADAVEEYGPLPPQSVLALGAGLAEALIAVHSAGLVHRDLKPSNVLLSPEGPRVIDFGIVRATDGYELTLSGVLLGSPRYMCPEHATGAQMGPEGDVFCLGSVLAFAATGNAPFDGASAATLLYKVVHGTPDLTGVPYPLDTIIGLCLDKSPTARPTPDRLSAACAPGGADTLNWDGWLPEPVAASAARQAADLMHLELEFESRDDVIEWEPARATSGFKVAGGVRTDPRPAVRHAVTDRPSPRRVVFPEERTPSSQPRKTPEPGTHRAQRPTLPRPSRRTVLAAAALGTVTLGSGVAALLGGPKNRPRSAPKPAGPAPKPLWVYRGDPLVEAPAVFYKGTALLKSQSGALFCLGLADGTRPRWTYRGISQSPTPPLLASDGVIALGTGSTVLGVDPVTGTERFSLDFGTDFRFDTLLGGLGNKVAIAGLRFNREDTPDGSQGAATSTNVVLNTDLRARLADVIPLSKEDIGLDLKPVVVTGHFIYMDGLHRLTARGTTSRADVLWRQPTKSDSDARSAPVVLGKNVFAVDSELIAVDVQSGALRWRAKEEKGGFASVAAAAGTVYCTTRNPHGVQAFDAVDGTRRWFRETPPLDLGNALVAGDGMVFVTAARNRDGFYAIDAQKGELLWNFTDGQDAGINDWQLSCDREGPLIAQHFDKVYALPMPRP